VRRYAAFVVVAGALALVAAGCGGSSGTTLHVVADNAAVKTIDLGANGKSPGDVYAFDGPVRDQDGMLQLGHVYGTQTEISLTSDSEIVQSLIGTTSSETTRSRSAESRRTREGISASSRASPSSARFSVGPGSTPTREAR
jgi:hypothetical protein